MNRRGVLALVLCLSLIGCATGTPGRSSPAVSGTGQPTIDPTAGASGAGIVLRRAPENLGCDAIGIDYRSLTFRIDPAATEQVSAVADTGVELETYWSEGFEASADERLIRDPAGEVVVADGDALTVPEGAYPRLGGYFVCLAPTSIYVLLNDPR